MEKNMENPFVIKMRKHIRSKRAHFANLNIKTFAVTKAK